MQYDYIIAGAGCAGLSLAMHMIRSGNFADKRILLIDREPKTENDRTWCFWETKEGLFEPVVYKKWQRLWFYGEKFSRELAMAPYEYKMIRGIDFYTYCLDEIGRQPNFTLRFEEIDHVFSSETITGVIVKGEVIHAQYVFNSILFSKPELSAKEYWLLQHFKGWVVETKDRQFDASIATLMDFRTSQEEGTAFCYLLPFSSHKALIEYTLFSPRQLEEEKYVQGLETYIRNVLKISAYKIVGEETGVIPMTNFKFSTRQNNIVTIGTAGGQTKGSSGYTFNFIQKHSQRLVQQLNRTGRPFLPPQDSRFSFYDSILLQLLYRRSFPGKTIFTQLFKKNPVPRVLRFLDNETSIGEELQIIATLPTWPFAKAAIKQIF